MGSSPSTTSHYCGCEQVTWLLRISFQTCKRHINTDPRGLLYGDRDTVVLLGNQNPISVGPATPSHKLLGSSQLTLHPPSLLFHTFSLSSNLCLHLTSWDAGTMQALRKKETILSRRTIWFPSQRETILRAKRNTLINTTRTIGINWEFKIIVQLNSYWKLKLNIF